MQWFRFYTEAISDKKLRRIARDNNESMAHVLGVWTIVLSMASDSPKRGRLLISNEVPATIDDINDAAGCNVTATFQKLLVTELVTVDVTDDGQTVYVVPAWDKRQFESDSSATRVRRHRERKKATQNSANVTEVKRYSNAPDTDTDTDTEDRLIDAQTPTAPPPSPQQRTDTELTQAISAKLESVGVSLSTYIVDTYVAAAMEHGIHAALAGISAASEQGKQQKTSYVLACIRNKAAGDERKANGKPPANGNNRNGTGPASKVEKSLANGRALIDMLEKGGTL
jgi:hypothetical protein